ncbi:MAG TPA: NADP-dependent malic enzyme [Candidatus Marinimicrobia bacterium]|nr:NADP-dependent malic enzyme [Candidatus Neomarinimicrobiota bacterium]HPI27508.1 NADP-dependent malic enzyme [Candidatus Neomarinimicrobiota bacterium]
MKQLKLDLSNLDNVFPENFTPEQIAQAKTLFFQKLSEGAHQFYGGKIQIAPRAGFFGFNWFNVWYTPGVSRISTTIRDDNDLSFELTNRGNLVAIVSDSTRVLGDGDVTPPGGLGVMEGKAFLMKYLGGVDAVPLCINSRDQNGLPNPDNIIQFVKMCEPSFGAINLEDISQPNCYKVLDVLSEECEIPVWHDDAQGTACVTLAGLINALKLAKKEIGEVKITMLGAGASNTTIARIIIAAGGDPQKIMLFDSRGGLHRNRTDIKDDSRFYRKWELCQLTNPKCVNDFAESCKGADVLIALSKPGPNVIKPEWIKSMADKAIVFACANPIPEIWPHAAKEAGAFIVATGRGDFPNQVNNSLGFPGILKGALIVRARKITDSMAIAAAQALADFAEKRGITPDNIIPKMDETAVFPSEVAAVAEQAVQEGIARRIITAESAFQQAEVDIQTSRAMFQTLIKESFIKELPESLLVSALEWAISQV